MGLTSGAEVCVVGGGVTGCAIAYLLAKQGVRTTLVEKDSIGAHASGTAAGTLNPLYGAGIPGPLQPLALESFRRHPELWQELGAETGIDVQGRRVPLAMVAFDAEEEAELGELARSMQGVGDFSIHWLSARLLRRMEPGVSPRAIGALVIEDIGSLDSHLYTLALSRAAAKSGAVIVDGEATGLESRGGRVVAVTLLDGHVTCDCLVLATGPWAGDGAGWLGMPISIPVYPLKGEILRLAAPGPGLRHILAHGGHYVARKADGLVWCGTTEQEVQFDDRPSQAARDSILQAAAELVPRLAGARVVRHTACLRPASRDGLPLLGPVPGWEDVYMATGTGRKGILLSPAVAQAIADLIVRGRTDLPISPFGLDRFAQAEVSQ